VETTISDYSDNCTDFTVLSLNRRVSELLSTAFPHPVWVKGEIAEVSRTNTRGHSYFKLIEPSPDGMGQPLAVMDCALFAGSRPPIVRSFARKGQVFQLTEGMTLRIQGRITVWDKGGRYQFIVEDIDPSWTMGDQAQKLRRLVDKLRKDGVLEANSELDIPLAPINIGLITSKNSAAEHDFLQGLRDSRFPFRVWAAYAPMQGSATTRGVIDSFNRLLSVPGLDAVVLTRGGGSATDLSWFNDEHIAGVISQVPWPVISAIGHETDSTLPDFVSHTSLKTPTHAADFLVNRISDLIGTLDSLSAALCRSASKRLAEARDQLSRSAAVMYKSGKLVFRAQKMELSSMNDWLCKSTLKFIASAQGKLESTADSLARMLETGITGKPGMLIDSLERALKAASLRFVEKRAMHLENLNAAVEGNNPQRLYKRGWATVRGSNGELLRSIKDTSIQEDIEVTLRDGSLVARTERIIPRKD
jgi:exodeoxyribonuclease VII large subunit